MHLRCSVGALKRILACKPPGCDSCLPQGLSVQGSCGELPFIAVAFEAVLLLQEPER